MKRKIVQIDQAKCNGCGLCVDACHEGAIELVDGKAKLVSDEYCDGLGDCLPMCPEDAISLVEREAATFDEEAVKKRVADLKSREAGPLPCGCPGTAEKRIHQGKSKGLGEEAPTGDIPRSHLQQWPIQMRLINPKAGYLNGARLLIAADCTAYAYGNFHREFIKDHITIIGCPKLDDNDYNREKLVEILKNNEIRAITVVRMEVPCCSGIVKAVKSAMLEAKTIVPYSEITITTGGDLLE